MTSQSTFTILGGFAPIDALWSGESPPFPSEQSARWVVRQHREALVNGHALALSRGRLFVHPERLSKIIEAAAFAAMRRRIEGPPGQGDTASK